MKPKDLSPLLEIANVTHRFGVVTALLNVTLTIYQDEFVSIFGPNGAGKTTLLKIVAGLLSPSSGTILFPEQIEPRNRLQIGYVSHQSLLYNDLTGFENLNFYASLYEIPDPSSAAEAQLLRMGLETAQHQLVKTYSSGMKQRLSIGRALLHQPSILLLDEPYAGLDQHGSRLLSKLLKKLKDECTILLITHNLEEGLALSERTLVMNRGRVLHNETMDSEMKQKFESTYFQLIDG